jgi:molecular chaperone HtpG
VLSLLDDLAANQPDRYATFWSEFGRVLKEGIVDDAGHRERIAKLLRFASTHQDAADETVSLSDYVARRKAGQEAIYYVTADGFSAAKNSPHLEVFRKHGVEVLLLGDRVDEWMLSQLTEFDGKKLRSASQGDLDVTTLGEPASTVADEAKADEYKDLLTRMQECLKDQANGVRLSHRLTDSPACLVSEEHGMSRHLERLLREAGQRVPASKPILEINPDHPIVARLRREADAAVFADWSRILFDQALLAEGGELEDPALFVRRLNKLTLALAGTGAPRIWTP